MSFFAYSQSSVSFKIKNAGLNPQNSKFNGTVVIKSINTGINKRDQHLVKPEYFDAAKYPHMTFNTNSVKTVDSNNLSVTGDLVIKGKSRKVTIPVKILTKGSKTRFTGEFTINRRDFGVGGSSLLLSDNLVVLLDITK
jgi:polyisoprenoid-binding protein YceI